MAIAFEQVFRGELDVINARRRGDDKKASKTSSPGNDGQTAELLGATKRMPRRFIVPRRTAVALKDTSESNEPPFATPVDSHDFRAKHDSESKRWDTVQLKPGANLTGIALSGGGIRSASFCLGALQALDALTKDNEPRVLDAVDYLSTVSGGGYIGASLVAALMQGNSFPFDSQLDLQETPETKHLRDYSNFLVPKTIDYLVDVATVLRGLLVNAVLVLPFLLLLAALTVAVYPVFESQEHRPFTLTLILACGIALFLFVSAVYTSVTFNTGTLRSRERLGRGLAAALVLLCGIAVFESQPFIISRMVCVAAAELDARADANSGSQGNPIKKSPISPTPTCPAAKEDSTSALVAAPTGPKSGSTDEKPAEGASPKESKTTEENAKVSGAGGGMLSWFARVFPTLAAVLGSGAALLITASQKLANLAKASLGDDLWTSLVKKYSSRFVLYLAAVIVPLLLWIAYLYIDFYGVLYVVRGFDAGDFIARFLPAPGMGDYLPIVAAYLLLAVVSFILGLFIGPNSNSLHALYRDRLGRAFLFDRAKLAASATGTNTIKNSGHSAETVKLSELKPRRPPEVGNAPYLLINTAINLEGSEELNRRGRDADVFIFSPLFVGSRATGYVPTADIEERFESLNLATAMAISGAAASANMGDMTIKPLTFSLSLLNIRLGYWLANPKRLDEFVCWINRARANIGAAYFALETAGKLDEKMLNVYLTDGGHIENLGVYELLRRRCKMIFAVDAEADPGMTFSALAHLELIARIDLGVTIDLPWQDLRKSALAVTDEAPYGPKGPPGANGLHAAIGVINYGEKETGILIYVKSSLSGDESDYLLDYKRRNDTFPQETTVDQFFQEEQFEVYRALGFHAVYRLLSGEDDFAKSSEPPKEFEDEVRKALALLNVPDSMARTVAARVRKKPANELPEPAGGV
jgi:hypothetical protein